MGEELKGLLPPFLREVADLIGMDKILPFIDEFGGARLFIPMPRNINEDHKIAKAIGLEAAHIFAERYHGPIIRIPTGKDYRIELRNREIVAKRLSGVTIFALAKEYRTSENVIYSIVNKKLRKNHGTSNPCHSRPKTKAARRRGKPKDKP